MIVLRLDLIPSDGTPVRLNVGCGVNYVPEFINIDVQQVGAVVPEILAPANAIPLPDACAEELMAIHVWEHFYRWDCDAVITEWHRLLKPNGLLVLEMPDLMRCAKNIIKDIRGEKHPDQLGLWGLYGDPQGKDPYMVHRWGWHGQSLMFYLLEHGFADPKQKETKFHAVGRGRRDMRVEARKV